jgi:hypothetical protein
MENSQQEQTEGTGDEGLAAKGHKLKRKSLTRRNIALTLKGQRSGNVTIKGLTILRRGVKTFNRKSKQD